MNHLLSWNTFVANASCSITAYLRRNGIGVTSPWACGPTMAHPNRFVFIFTRTHATIVCSLFGLVRMVNPTERANLSVRSNETFRRRDTIFSWKLSKKLFSKTMKWILFRRSSCHYNSPQREIVKRRFRTEPSRKMFIMILGRNETKRRMIHIAISIIEL